MIVIADTSPVNYLILIGEIEVLPKIYGSIVIPPAVHAELLAQGSPNEVRRWASSPPDWFEIKRLKSTGHNEFTSILGAGESEAISLATEIDAEIILIDELAGRKVAMEKGIRIVGTIGVLIAAKQKKLIDADSAVAKLKGTNFRVSEELLKLLKS